MGALFQRVNGVDVLIAGQSQGDNKLPFVVITVNTILHQATHHAKILLVEAAAIITAPEDGDGANVWEVGNWCGITNCQINTLTQVRVTPASGEILNGDTNGSFKMVQTQVPLNIFYKTGATTHKINGDFTV